MCSLSLLESKRANGTETSGGRFLPEDDKNLFYHTKVILSNADLGNLSEGDFPARSVVTIDTKRV